MTSKWALVCFTVVCLNHVRGLVTALDSLSDFLLGNRS